MAIELYNDGRHICLAFHDLVGESEDAAVQSNQFLIVDNGCGALIDPGGSLTYSALLTETQRYLNIRSLELVLASHADPDIVSSINKWFVATPCRLAISRLWLRFIPHMTNGRHCDERLIGIPDEGMNIRLGDCTIKALPAHFLHAEGNFHFYDPVSKILFSGDLGGSFGPAADAGEAVRDFDEHLRHMAGFHRRYMVSNRVCRLWTRMVRQLDVRMIVPQHGSRIAGTEMVGRFLDWVDVLVCGVDLMTEAHYEVP